MLLISIRTKMFLACYYSATFGLNCSCFSNEELCNHLESEDHRDLISVINRSVPTIIQKIDLNSCHLCHQSFRPRVGLKRHMRYVHGISDFCLENHKKFVCRFCQFSSYKQKAIETHQFLGKF